MSEPVLLVKVGATYEEYVRAQCAQRLGRRWNQRDDPTRRPAQGEFSPGRIYDEDLGRRRSLRLSLSGGAGVRNESEC